jgi:hypothetical protein
MQGERRNELRVPVPVPVPVPVSGIRQPQRDLRSRSRSTSTTEEEEEELKLRKVIEERKVIVSMMRWRKLRRIMGPRTLSDSKLVKRHFKK